MFLLRLLRPVYHCIDRLFSKSSAPGKHQRGVYPGWQMTGKVTVFGFNLTYPMKSAFLGTNVPGNLFNESLKENALGKNGTSAVLGLRRFFKLGDVELSEVDYYYVLYFTLESVITLWSSAYDCMVYPWVHSPAHQPTPMFKKAPSGRKRKILKLPPFGRAKPTFRNS